MKRFGRLLSARSLEPMRVIEMNTEQCRNERMGHTGDPRENPPTGGIIGHDSHMRKSESGPVGAEPVSPWREVSRLTAESPLPLVNLIESQKWEGLGDMPKEEELSSARGVGEIDAPYSIRGERGDCSTLARRPSGGAERGQIITESAIKWPCAQTLLYITGRYYQSFICDGAERRARVSGTLPLSGRSVFTDGNTNTASCAPGTAAGRSLRLFGATVADCDMDAQRSARCQNDYFRRLVDLCFRLHLPCALFLARSAGSLPPPAKFLPHPGGAQFTPSLEGWNQIGAHLWTFGYRYPLPFPPPSGNEIQRPEGRDVRASADMRELARAEVPRRHCIPMRMIEVSVEQHRNDRTGYPRENLPTSGIARQDSQKRKFGLTRSGNEPGSPFWDASRLTAQSPRNPLGASPVMFTVALQTPLTVMPGEDERDLLCICLCSMRLGEDLRWWQTATHVQITPDCLEPPIPCQ
ncbi:hypothetical protein PR048_017974 [Dryococelus australis]|uniref:Uncharacterized protein n=1 Tax=Dryococelus australis TaxID=614101 RepID=A0ABQ9HB26_9NEOP|nr:hypothetical protein PR048_017974 [Dryococelus australis]